MERKLLTAFFFYKLRAKTNILLILRFVFFIGTAISFAIMPFYFDCWKFALSSFILFCTFQWINTLVVAAINKLVEGEVCYFPVHLQDMKNNKNFVKKYGKFYSNVFFDFNETDDQTLIKSLIGVRICIDNNEIVIDDPKKAAYVVKEIRQNAENYRLVNGVYKLTSPNVMSKQLINHIAENIFHK